jgi:hypothetical protein
MKSSPGILLPGLLLACSLPEQSLGAPGHDDATDGGTDATEESDTTGDVEEPAEQDDRDWVGVSGRCGLRPDGTLWCWGWNDRGQRGDGTLWDLWSLEDGQLYEIEAAEWALPTQVVATEDAVDGSWSDWVAVSTSSWTTCGLRENGTLWCWGWIFPSTPTRVLAAEEDPGEPPQIDWIAFSLSHDVSCGLRADGSLWCWGTCESYHFPGCAVGDGNEGIPVVPGTTSRQVVAAEESGEPPWTDWIAVTGGFTTCGLRANNTLWCWGPLAIPGVSWESTRIRNTPVELVDEDSGASFSDWIAISGHCGLRANGTLWCWDGLRSASIGASVHTKLTRVPAAEESEEPFWSDWVAVSNPRTNGRGTACGLRADGTLWCWWRGSGGWLGDGTTTEHRETPTRVVAAEESGEPPWSDWIAVSGSCGLREDGSVWCWGFHGQSSDWDNPVVDIRTTPYRVRPE